MTINGHTSLNYAANICGTTVITRAFDRANAVKFMQAKDSSVIDKDVYVYEGITNAAPIDEVYSDSVREQDDKGNACWKDVYKVRLTDMYAHLAK